MTIDELRAKALASMSNSNPTSNPNSYTDPNPKKRGKSLDGEGGEPHTSLLPDSDNTKNSEIPSSSAGQLAFLPATLAVEANAIRPNQQTKGSSKGKLLSCNGSRSSLSCCPTATVSKSYNKHFVTNSVPIKSGNNYKHGWLMPSVQSKDFLISFSEDEDDSTSDSEEHTEPKKVQQTALKQIKATPEEVMPSRQVVSPVTRGVHSLRPGSDKMFPARKSVPVNKGAAVQKYGITQPMNLNRKRENLLQGLTLQGNRKNPSNINNSELLQDRNGEGINKSNNRKVAPEETVQSDHTIPDRKRPRSNEPEQRMIDSVGKKKIVKSLTNSISKLKMPLAETVDPRNIKVMPHTQYPPVEATSTAPIIARKRLDGSETGTSFNSLLEVVPFSAPAPALPNEQGGHILSDAVILDHCTDLNGEAEEVACEKNVSSTKKPESLMKANLLNGSDLLNSSKHHKIDTEALMKIEELQDKELEEAQEYRHKCEMEERKAMKIYREAQRALVEANAKCTHLYRTRESFSARFRALLMEDADSFWSSRCHKQTENEMGSLAMDLDHYESMLATTSHQMQPSGCNLVVDSTIRHASGAGTSQPASSTSGLLHHMDSNIIHQPETSGRNLVANSNIQRASNAVMLELVVSNTELAQHKDNTVVSSDNTGSSQTSNQSHNTEDEDAPFGHVAFQSKPSCQNEDFTRTKVDSISNLGSKQTSKDTHDLALLEQSLRSKLLGKKIKLGCPVQSISKGCTIDKEVEILSGNERHHIETVNQTHEEMEGIQISKVQGTDEQIGTKVFQPFDVKNNLNEYGFPDYESDMITDLEEGGYSKVCRPIVPDSLLPSSVLNIVFSLVLVSAPISFRRLGFKAAVEEKDLSDISYEEDGDVGFCKDGIDFMSSSLTDDPVKCLDFGNLGCYTCFDSLDPLWPVCMFELRGKCNDDECLLQHVKDYPEKNMKQLKHSTNFDSRVGLSQLDKISAGGVKYSPNFLGHNLLTSPSYLVGFNLLNSNIQTSGPYLAGRNLRPAYQFHNGSSDACIGGQLGWNMRSLYLQNQDGEMFKHRLADPDQALDLALVLLNGEANKVKGKKKSLSLLSRAIEANPKSIALWFLYLHLYEKSEMANTKDDMFSHAINNYDGSYELWLMYINNRVKLEERLHAYERALSALCRHVLADHDSEKVHLSACILDLLLQMIECFCMSGGVNKFVPKIHQLIHHSSEFLSNILTCLTISDRCIFWVCCMYLLIHQKLPDPVVQQFEFEKTPMFDIVWPSVNVTDDKKLRVMELLEMATQSVELSSNDDVNQMGSAQRMASMFAISHVKCVAMLESIKHSKILLEEYIRLYPTSLELILTSTRFYKVYSGESDYEGFEAALRNWPSEVPGIQSIWNQYARFAMENEGIDFAKQLMVRWYQSDSRNNFLDNKLSGVTNGDDIFDCKSIDLMFMLLNFSLFKLMHNETVEARAAIEKALTVAPAELFIHCAGEYAVFSFSDVSDQMQGTNGNRVLSLLKSYLVDASVLPVSDPLSRRFCQNIRKPRIRQFINSILGPISSDSSLLNSILEALHGPSLLPERVDELKDLVDFVEALMEQYPFNYRLAMSICKFIIKHLNSSNNFASSSVTFWASSFLVTSICEVIPVAPERYWVEAAGVLCDLLEVQDIPKRFYERGLSVYPVSLNLWKSCYKISEITGKKDMVTKAARETGIMLK